MPTRWGAGHAAAILAALAVLAVVPASLRAAPDTALPPGLTVSLQDDHLPVTADSNIEARLDMLASTGVRVTRVDVLWNAVAPTRPADADEPNDPAYRWSRYDRVVDGLTRRGIAAILNVYRSPSWANGGRSHQWAPDEDDFAAFMTALARRYDGRTADRAGGAHGPVEMFEPWNEPNLPGFLLPQWRTGPDGSPTPASPDIYARLLERAYSAVKAVQPDAWVIGVSGGPNGSDNPPSGSVGIVTFVRGLVASRPRADAFAQHLYPALGPTVSTAMPSFNRLPELITELDAVRPGLPILITEFGWTTQATSARSGHVTEQEQATFLQQAVPMLAGLPRVRLAVWFNMQDNAQWTAGLRRVDGSTKPSWDVFAGTPKLVGGSQQHQVGDTGPAPPPPPVQTLPMAPPAIAKDARCKRWPTVIRATTARMTRVRRAARRAGPVVARRAATKRLRAIAAQRAKYRVAYRAACR